MTQHANSIEKILQLVHRRELTPEEAITRLEHSPTQSLEFARVDHHRAERQGLGEVVYCEGKTDAQIMAITKELATGESPVLLTRANRRVYDKIKQTHKNAIFHPRSRAIVINPGSKKKTGFVLVVSAGTSDIPVAEEAAVTAEVMGARVETVYDVGVAGIHRLFEQMEKLKKARVIVVVAGMDGALPSVIGGLVDRPVVAVPVSTGYGAAFGGLSALLTMLNSCAAGVAVMNIDNGFGAGALAGKINRLPENINS